VCGNHLAVGYLVKFKVTMSLVGEEEEVVIKVIKIRDGNETCLVGFLPRHIGHGSRKDKLRNKYAQVLELQGISRFHKEKEESPPCWRGFALPLGRYPGLGIVFRLL
jgi:hypothetical protein